MAVYTKITSEEIVNHLRNYSIGTLLSFKEILNGIDNSNFILETSEGKFILTIFESRLNENDLPFFINLKLHLAKKGICCPRPIPSNSGSAVVTLKGKKSVIVTFLNGKSAERITPFHCFEVGKLLARLHLAAADFPMSRVNDLGINGFQFLFSRLKHLLEKDLADEIQENLEFLESSWRHDLPTAPAHLDLFPDNVFFGENGEISGVIDFYFAANDSLIYDFAVAVNAWGGLSELIQGYESVRKFSSAEKDFLKIALAGSAMRFLLTRLHDQIFTPENSFVQIKDPQEYLEKLRNFRSLL
ncbi:MAG: homoserine kinase [Alphaproteobacteria bacterium]|nr:homoserine kinase [Alphaproteobacteria bacterium]